MTAMKNAHLLPLEMEIMKKFGNLNHIDANIEKSKNQKVDGFGRISIYFPRFYSMIYG